MAKNPEKLRRRMLAALVVAAPGLLSRKGLAATAEPVDIEQPEKPGANAFIERAFVMQRRAIEIGDQGYGAVVVRNGKIIGQAPSHVIVNRDPTAHAEMEAIRDAATRLGSRNLSGCTLYSSSHPCPMCEAAAYWANIENMVWGKDARDAGSPGLCG